MKLQTKDKLAQALMEANLPEMAEKATKGLYDDFLSPDPLAAVTLAKDLEKVGTKKARELLKRHLAGEFDATKEESDEWMKSEDGTKALEELASAIFGKSRIGTSGEYYKQMMEEFTTKCDEAPTAHEMLLFLEACNGGIISTASFLFHLGVLNEDTIRDACDKLKASVLDKCLTQQARDDWNANQAKAEAASIKPEGGVQ